MQQVTELRRANTLLRQFADKAAHDFRQPLFVVATALELLSGHVQETQDAEAKKFVDHGVEGVQQLRAVMSQLQASVQMGARGISVIRRDRAVIRTEKNKG